MAARPSITWRMVVVVCVLAAAPKPNAVADELLFGYEADVHPSEVTGNLNPCEPPSCVDAVVNGHYVAVWPNGVGDQFAYIFDIARYPVPPPPSLWVEWRFRSNRPKSPIRFDTDGNFRIQYRGTDEIVNMYGDASIDASGAFGVVGHPLNEFRTYRYESTDGTHYRVSVDGHVFLERDEFNDFTSHYLNMRGIGGSTPDSIPGAENAWDFVRFGTLSGGERLVASDPPGGFLDPDVFAGIDRFTVTFDQPCYVYIEDVSVQVTGGGAAPQVIQARRLNNGAPETVEIVLDGPLPIGETTTFTFDTGLEPPEENVLSYTLAPPPIGACCDDATGVCTPDVALPDCDAAGGRFGGEASTCMTIDPPCLPPPPTGGCCDDATGECSPDVTQVDCEATARRYGGDDSTCATIAPPCLPPPPTGACCNDATGLCSADVTQSDCESNGRRYGGDDSTCATINPPCVPPPPTGACCDDDTGMCSDDVTQSDCESTARRYSGDDSDCSTIDPPCASPAIPAASTWGLAVLTLLLLVAGKILFGRSDSDARPTGGRVSAS